MSLPLVSFPQVNKGSNEVKDIYIASASRVLQLYLGGGRWVAFIMTYPYPIGWIFSLMG
jgi:hypothetical protein